MIVHSHTFANQLELFYSKSEGQLKKYGGNI